ncbi:MAG TPA: hypothetical protein VN953_00990 [Gemmatimonadales bacterium]|nr:hypothetical protein [Gemmatimonadales bacterium]
MVLRIVIAALMWMGLVACGIAQTTEAWRLLDKVNAMLPRDRRFNPIGWHFAKQWDFREEYERLGFGRYPPRHLRRIQIAFFLFGAGMVIALAPYLFQGKWP